jgi:hypothetical protein
VSFEICGSHADVETFAIGSRFASCLRKLYGQCRWTIRKAELHWYEASGVGKKEFKIKRFVD